MTLGSNAAEKMGIWNSATSTGHLIRFESRLDGRAQGLYQMYYDPRDSRNQ